VRRVQRQLTSVLAVLAIAGCATSQPPSDDADPRTFCGEPRPMVCTMEYRPVCAGLIEGGEKTYSSPCNACADVAVAHYTPQACEVE